MRSNLFVFFPCHADLPHCVRHIPFRLSRGLATLRVPFPFPLAAGICRTACVTSLPARRGGPCKTVVYQGVARLGEPLFRFWGAGLVKASFQRPGPQNEISIALAMLTP